MSLVSVCPAHPSPLSRFLSLSFSAVGRDRLPSRQPTGPRVGTYRHTDTFSVHVILINPSPIPHPPAISGSHRGVLSTPKNKTADKAPSDIALHWSNSQHYFQPVVIRQTGGRFALGQFTPPRRDPLIAFKKPPPLPRQTVGHRQVLSAAPALPLPAARRSLCAILQFAAPRRRRPPSPDDRGPH